jgi:hypothetical protein
MNADKHDAAVGRSGSTVPIDQSRDLRRWWSAITNLIAFAILMEAVFAGAMLSGVAWARAAHAADAAIVVASSLVAGLICVISLRRVSGGTRLGATLLALAAVVFIQAAVGALAEKGANLLWIHIPLGVALFGFATRVAITARRLARIDV